LGVLAKSLESPNHAFLSLSYDLAAVGALVTF